MNVLCLRGVSEKFRRKGWVVCSNPVSPKLTQGISYLCSPEEHVLMFFGTSDVWRLGKHCFGWSNGLPLGFPKEFTFTVDKTRT